MEMLVVHSLSMQRLFMIQSIRERAGQPGAGGGAVPCAPAPASGRPLAGGATQRRLTAKRRPQLTGRRRPTQRRPWRERSRQRRWPPPGSRPRRRGAARCAPPLGTCLRARDRQGVGACGRQRQRELAGPAWHCTASLAAPCRQPHLRALAPRRPTASPKEQPALKSRHKGRRGSPTMVSPRARTSCSTSPLSPSCSWAVCAVGGGRGGAGRGGARLESQPWVGGGGTPRRRRKQWRKQWVCSPLHPLANPAPTCSPANPAPGRAWLSAGRASIGKPRR